MEEQLRTTIQEREQAEEIITKQITEEFKRIEEELESERKSREE